MTLPAIPSSFRTALLALTAASTLAAQEPLVPATDLRPLDALAQKLAKGGRDRSVTTVLDVLEDLGYPERSLTALEGKTTKALQKAKPERFKAGPAVKSLDDALAKLVPACAEADGDRTARIARAILTLDGSVEAAHEALGHVRAHGRWVEPWMTAILDREVEVERALAEARAFSREPARVTTSDDVFLEKALGEKGTLVSGFGVTVHGSLGRDGTTAVVQDFARASAFAGYLLHGEVGTLRPRPFHYVFVHSKELYDKLVDAYVSDGRMPANEGDQCKKATFFWEPRNESFVMLGRTPTEMSAFLIAETLDSLQYRTQQLFRAGLAHYVSLAVLGHPIVEYSADGTAAAARTKRDGDRLDPRTSLLGLRAFAAQHAAKGAKPTFRDLFQHGDIADFRGDALAVATSVMMMLCAERPMDPVLKECHGSEATDADARITQFETALAKAGADPATVDAIEARWTAWASADRTSLADTLRGEADDDGAHKLGKALLAELDERRTRALASRGENELEPEPVAAHPHLSARARAHARYVASLDPATVGSATRVLEEPTQDAFSIQGMRAAPRCLVSTRAADGADAVLDSWLGSFEARLELLHPGLTHVGLGIDGSSLALDARTLRGDVEWGCLVQWPHPDMKGVPTRATGADAGDGPAGYPITVQVFDGTEPSSGALQLELFVGNPSKGERVDCESRASGNATILLPRAELEARTEYSVVGTFANQDRFVWKFRT